MIMQLKHSIKMSLIAVLILFIPLFSFAATQTAIATFAMGCFWCAQADFNKVPGVLRTVVGYTGGNVTNPTYEQVSQGGTRHYEALEVFYDPDKVNYSTLLNVFWHNIDPTDATGQFCDKGGQYRAVIFYHDAMQQTEAEKSKQAIKESKNFPTIATQILPASTFYVAEEYHQNYYKKNPIRYKFYRANCGRDRRLQQVWGH